jgi:hypothetical protein
MEGQLQYYVCDMLLLVKVIFENLYPFALPFREINERSY